MQQKFPFLKLRFSVVMPIIILNIAVFFLQLIYQNSFLDYVILQQGDLFRAPWTLLTSMFLHGSGLHLLFNMYALMVFGPMLEQKIGPERFLLAYLGTGLFASMISQFFYSAALGASGAVMGIIGLIIFLMPNLPVVFFFIVPMPLWVAGLIIAALDIFGVIGIGQEGIANLAHLAGLAMGLAIGFFFGKQKERFYRKFSKSTELDDNDIEEYIKSGRL